MTLSLAHITFDAVDAAALAGFWSAVLGHPVDDGASADFATISPGHGVPGWMFVKVPEAKQVKNRCHPDLSTANLAVEVERVVALGAARLGDFDEYGARWATLRDPEGNEFDLVADH